MSEQNRFKESPERQNTTVAEVTELLRSNNKKLLEVMHRYSRGDKSKRARGDSSRTTQDFNEKNAHYGEACPDFESLFAPLFITPYPYSSADQYLRSRVYRTYENASMPRWIDTARNGERTLATDSLPLIRLLGGAATKGHIMPRGVFLRIRSGMPFDLVAGNTHNYPESQLMLQECTYATMQYLPWQEYFDDMLASLQPKIIIPEANLVYPT